MPSGEIEERCMIKQALRLSALALAFGLSAMAVNLAMLTNSASCAERSFKGWELYSWQDGNKQWSYALLIGTNRLKFEAEVLKESKSLAKLKVALEDLAEGEYVTWVDESNLKFEKIHPSFPPPDIDLKEIEQSCKTAKLNLHKPSRLPE
jgi:hypothetical protein